MRTDTSPWALLLVPLVAVAVGCGGGDDAEPVTDRPSGQAPPAAVDTPAADTAAGGESVQQGRQIFTSNGLCFSCHGADATGTALAPDLTDDQWIWVDPAAGDMRTQITTIIRTGVSVPQEYPGPMLPMGGGQLSDEQIDAVASYVLSLNPQG